MLFITFYATVKNTRWFCLLFSAHGDDLAGLSGPSRVEPSRAGPGRARPDPSRAEPGRAEPSRAEPGQGFWCRGKVTKRDNCGTGAGSPNVTNNNHGALDSPHRQPPVVRKSGETTTRPTAPRPPAVRVREKTVCQTPYVEKPRAQDELPHQNMFSAPWKFCDMFWARCFE